MFFNERFLFDDDHRNMLASNAVPCPRAVRIDAIASPSCSRAVALSAPIRPASIRPCMKPIFMPDWVSGVSIGAINAAIIAGNPPHRRLAQLHAFWDLITERKIWAYTPDGDVFRKARNATSSMDDHGRGTARLLHPALHQPLVQLHRSGMARRVIYDSEPLRETLQRSRRLLDHQRSSDPLRRRCGQRAHRQFHLFRQLRGGDRP